MMLIVHKKPMWFISSITLRIIFSPSIRLMKKKAEQTKNGKKAEKRKTNGKRKTGGDFPGRKAGVKRGISQKRGKTQGFKAGVKRGISAG